MTGLARQHIDDEAAKWAARSLSGDMSPEEEAALKAWLADRPDRQQAYDSYMDIADLAAEADDLVAAAALERDLEHFASERVAKKSWLVAAPAMAASVAAAALFFNFVSPSQIEPQRYATERGETAEFALSDGSIVSLNTDSALEVRFTRNERRVVLAHGEALFDVVRNTEKPFVVASENAAVRVLGTRFNVRAQHEETVVSVLSGVVEVGKPDEIEKSQAALTLIAGQETAIGDTIQNAEVRTFNPDAVTAWRRGEAYYENKPLSYVIADLNRYYAHEIAIGDERLAAIPVTGEFDLENQEITVKALTVALALRAEKSAEGKIVLLPNE